MSAYAFPRGTGFADRLERIGDCLVFLGSTNGQGYGELRIDGRKVYAHRHAFEKAHGSISEGMIVKHSCDNPPCCNPDHLSAGTHAENMREAYERGRIKQRRLDPAVRSLILAMRFAGESYASISTAMGLSPSRCCHIAKGR